MDAAFQRQVDEQREFLARGEQQRLIGMAHFWRTQYCEAYVAHLTVLITLYCYHEIRDATDSRVSSQSPHIHITSSLSHQPPFAVTELSYSTEKKFPAH